MRTELTESYSPCILHARYLLAPYHLSLLGNKYICPVVGLQYWSKLRSQLIELHTFLGDSERILVTGSPIRA